MSGYRLYDPNPVYFDLLTLQPLAGGALQFFDIGTTNPRPTYSDEALTIPNANPVPLDSAGRASVNVWLDGDYTVRLLNSLGATIWTRDVTTGASGGLVIPTPLVSGQVLSNDGSTLRWLDLLQVPDPTGSDGQLLATAGGAYVLVNPTAAPTLPTTGDNFVQVNNIRDQWGTATIPASNSKVSAVNVTFPTAYIDTPDVKVAIRSGSGVVSAGFIGCLGVSAVSGTGCTIAWDLNIAQTGSTYNLTSPLLVSWRAIGKVAS